MGSTDRTEREPPLARWSSVRWTLGCALPLKLAGRSSLAASSPSTAAPPTTAEGVSLGLPFGGLSFGGLRGLGGRVGERDALLWALMARRRAAAVGGAASGRCDSACGDSACGDSACGDSDCGDLGASGSDVGGGCGIGCGIGSEGDGDDC